MNALLVPTQHPGREMVSSGYDQKYQRDDQTLQGDFNGKTNLLFFINEAAFALEVLFSGMKSIHGERAQ